MLLWFKLQQQSNNHKEELLQQMNKLEIIQIGNLSTIKSG